MSTNYSVDANQIYYNDQQSAGIFVGASSAVSAYNLSWFTANNINGVLNVAFDVDDTVFSAPTPPPPPPPPNLPAVPAVASTACIQFAKVGLVDTGPFPGFSQPNQAQTLVAAVYMLDQLKTRAGTACNVLVHCASGGSRSVAVAALWMAQRLPIAPVSGQTRFQTALNAVRQSRHLGSQPYDPTQPDAPDFNDGKPMASHFYMAQAIDQTMNLFPSSGTSAASGWPPFLSWG